jgi:hypothetical protein
MKPQTRIQPIHRRSRLTVRGFPAKTWTRCAADLLRKQPARSWPSVSRCSDPSRGLGRFRGPGGVTSLRRRRVSPARRFRGRPGLLLLPRRRRTRNGRKARLVAWEGTRVGFHLRCRPVRTLRRRAWCLVRRRRRRTLASIAGWLATSVRTARSLSSASCVEMSRT